jgi:hypothetical protein
MTTCMPITIPTMAVRVSLCEVWAGVAVGMALAEAVEGVFVGFMEYPVVCDESAETADEDDTTSASTL